MFIQLSEGNINAPHRTGLVVFPHPALQRRSRNRRQSIKIMHYTWFGQWIVAQVFIELFPIERFALTTPVQPLIYQSNRELVVSFYRLHVPADSIVLIVPSQFRGKNWPPYLHFLHIAHALKPLIHLFAPHAKLLPTRSPAYYEFPLPAYATVMGKSQKIKGVGFPLLPLCVLSFISAKTQYTGLLRV